MITTSDKIIESLRDLVNIIAECIIITKSNKIVEPRWSIIRVASNVQTGISQLLPQYLIDQLRFFRMHHSLNQWCHTLATYLKCHRFINKKWATRNWCNKNLLSKCEWSPHKDQHFSTRLSIMRLQNYCFNGNRTYRLNFWHRAVQWQLLSLSLWSLPIL